MTAGRARASAWKQREVATIKLSLGAVLAVVEERCRQMLAEELVRLTQRILILEQRIAAELQVDIHAMIQYLTERERETYLSLKRFKG